MTDKFTLQQRTIYEIVTEVISENQTVTYAYNYEYNEKPKSIAFYLHNNSDANLKLITGSCYVATGQLDLKTVEDIENVGQIIDNIKISIQNILDQLPTNL